MTGKLIAGLLLVALLAATPAEEPKTIADILTESKDHKILMEAAAETGLIDTLRGQGEWTVFAPTDAAFKRLDEATLKRISGDKALLTAFLWGHVTKGALSSADVVKFDGKKVETLSGSKFRVVVAGKDVTIGGAKVVRLDVKASNGVVHVIDAALLPPK